MDAWPLYNYSLCDDRINDKINSRITANLSAPAALIHIINHRDSEAGGLNRGMSQKPKYSFSSPPKNPAKIEDGITGRSSSPIRFAGICKWARMRYVWRNAG